MPHLDEVRLARSSDLWIAVLYEDQVARICKPRIAENSRAMTITEDRYRMLLSASSALADQPTVKAVLHSLRGVLSSTSRLHGAELYVLSDDGEGLVSFEFDRDGAVKAVTH